MRRDPRGILHYGFHGRLYGDNDTRTSKVVGVAVGPLAEEPVIYGNEIDNIQAAVKERIDKTIEGFPFDITTEDRHKIGRVIATSVGFLIKANRD